MLRPHLLTPACLLLVVAACGGGASGDYTIDVSGSSATSGNCGISSGGYRLARGEDPFLYGTVLDHGKRSYAYLVLIRDKDPVQVGFDFSSNGSSEIGDGLMSSGHVLRLGDSSVRVQHRVRIDSERNELVDRELTVQGIEFDPETSWLFLFDTHASDAELSAVDLARPELPEIHQRVAGFTSAYVADLVRTNSEIRAFLNR